MEAPEFSVCFNKNGLSETVFFTLQDSTAYRTDRKDMAAAFSNRLVNAFSECLKHVEGNKGLHCAGESAAVHAARAN